MINAAKFTGKSFGKVHRPTAMSIAMAAAGIIPGTHITTEPACTATLRHIHDNRNIRPSVRVSL